MHLLFPFVGVGEQVSASQEGVPRAERLCGVPLRFEGYAEVVHRRSEQGIASNCLTELVDGLVHLSHLSDKPAQIRPHMTRAGIKPNGGAVCFDRSLSLTGPLPRERGIAEQPRVPRRLSQGLAVQIQRPVPLSEESIDFPEVAGNPRSLGSKCRRCLVMEDGELEEIRVLLQDTGHRLDEMTGRKRPLRVWSGPILDDH